MELILLHFHSLNLFFILDPLTLFILVVSKSATFSCQLFYKVVDHLLLSLTLLILPFQLIFQLHYVTSNLSLSFQYSYFAIHL